MLLSPFKAIALVAALQFFCSPAWAHGGLGDAKSVWGGASHFLTSPLSLASIAGLSAALFGVSEKLSLMVSIVAGVAAGTATAVASYLPTYAAPAAVVIVGLSAVSGLKPSTAAAFLLAIIAGMAAGTAADLDAPSWPGAIGVAGSVMFLLVTVLSASHDLVKMPKLQSILPIARRVLGSWVAAIGLLMTTLAIHLSKT